MVICKPLTIATLILSLTLALSACSAVNNAVEEALQGGIQTGTCSEDGTTFTNEWSNINFTLPDGFRALSSGEIQAAVGAGDDVAVNKEFLCHLSGELFSVLVFEIKVA